jgi:hypothetical protein
MSQASFLAAYDGFGERRTGGTGDAASATWLRDLAAATGAEARLMPVPFSHFIPGTASIEVEGHCIQGLPLFDGGTTDAKGVTGALGPLGSAAPIGVVEMEPRAASLPGNAFALARRESRHAAVVVALRTQPDSAPQCA